MEVYRDSYNEVQGRLGVALRSQSCSNKLKATHVAKVGSET